MRVDKDWEDGIGKRLYDFEGELSPMDWNNISRQIKPRRNKRYFWLPALLVFLALPGALYFADPLGWFPNAEQQISVNQAEISAEKSVNSPSETVAIQAEKPEAVSNPDAVKNTENGITSDAKTANEFPEIVEGTGQYNAENKPGKVPATVALIAANRPGKPLVTEEKESRTENQKPDSPSGTAPIYAARSGNQQAGILAFNQTGKKRNDNVFEKPKTAGNIQEKTVAFNPKKAGTTFIISDAGKDSEVNSSEVNKPAANLISSDNTRPEIAVLDLKSTGLMTADFTGLLPDSLKKYLIATLPEPANGDEENKRKQDKKPSKNWALAVYATPHYTFQRVLPNQNDAISILKMENKNTFETERLGYEAGIRGYYPVRKNLELTFGFQAALVKQHLRLQTMNMQPDSVVVKQQANSISMQVYNTPRNENHLFSYFFGGIFTGMNLRVSEKLDLSGGLGMNWLLQTRSSEEKSDITGKSFNPYLHFGLQYQQPISRKLTLTTGPTMQYYLKPMQEKQAFIGVKPTVIGFSVGVKFKP